MKDVFFPFPDRDASRHILERDPCYGKILSDDVDLVFQDAWQVGEVQADSFWNTFEMQISVSMRSFLEQEGLKIQVLDEDYISGNMRYFCEYISQKNIVKIYKKSVQLWAESNQINYEDGLNLILAHEYFHYLEWHKIGLTSKRYLVPMLKIGRVRIGKTGIAALSEIAANAFANRFYKRMTAALPNTAMKKQSLRNIGNR